MVVCKYFLQGNCRFGGMFLSAPEDVLVALPHPILTMFSPQQTAAMNILELVEVVQAEAALALRIDLALYLAATGSEVAAAALVSKSRHILSGQALANSS
jgi:hypothetical protein